MDKKISFKRELFQWLATIAVAIVLSFGIRTYVFAKTVVDGPSMMPTLENNDNNFVEKISLLTSTFKQGQIIIFDSENSKHDTFVKRVIGVPGDEVEITKGKVYVNGEELNEPYLKANTITKGGPFLKVNQKLKIEKGFVFVLGDNREVSDDSRYFGPIKISQIQGHVILRIYPFNQVRLFN